jgi:hypothetical protein
MVRPDAVLDHARRACICCAAGVTMLRRARVAAREKGPLTRARPVSVRPFSTPYLRTIASFVI